MANFEFLEALGQIARDQNIDEGELLIALANALLAAYKRRPDSAEDAEVEINPETGEIKVWGLELDIEGNVMEFVLDWSAPYMSACTDCAYLAASSNRAIRGADCCFYGTESNLQAWGRNHDAPTSSEYYYGFRCARTP